MSAREYAYRIDVVAKAHDGAWSVICWELLEPTSGETHESACFWNRTAGEARRIWQTLDAGRIPRELAGSMAGWAGLVISPVQVWIRYRRADGWGPWKRHETYEDGRLKPKSMDDTHEIVTGTLAGDDDRRAA